MRKIQMGTLTPRAEHQRSHISKITNDGLTGLAQDALRCTTVYPYGNSGRQRDNIQCRGLRMGVMRNKFNSFNRSQGRSYC